MHINLSDPLTHVFTLVMLRIALVFTAILIAMRRRARAKLESSIIEAKDRVSNTSYTSVQAIFRKKKQLQSEKAALKDELQKHKRAPSEMVAYILVISGIVALAASILYSSSILAFVGLGLTFWGALFLFIRPTRYVKASLLESTARSSLEAIDRIIKDLNYEGKAIYLPPTNTKALKGGTVFVPSKKGLATPPVEEVVEERVFSKNPEGICLTPPGLSLANLYENELGKDFAKVDLSYLQNSLPKLFIEDLEIAEDLEMNIEGAMVRVKITESIHKDLCNEVKKFSNTHGILGCPLCSSIAIALTRATRKPVIIERTEVSEGSEVIETYFRIIEE